MNFLQHCSNEEQRLKKQIEILHYRQQIYEYALKISIDEGAAEKMANGTLFGCNSNYKASGHGLTDAECEDLNYYYDQIDRLLNDIKAIR
ncbi:MAG: hypothetical protein JNM22_02045 [Saprospiraceae bacterium]|nr:hypothetical protein [Saprospiraceae bacterium]